MTTPDPPDTTATLLPTTALGAPGATVGGEARAVLLAAREDVADAAAGARRSLGVAWESAAAQRFRDEVAALLAELDGDLGRLEELAGVLGP